MSRPVSRRGFLGLSLTAGAVAAALSGCTESAPNSPGSLSAPATPTGPSTSGAKVLGPAAGEAAQDGTNDWHLGRIGVPEAVEGYADKTDVAPGERFTLYISSTARSVDIDALRMGAYRRGNARLVWSTRGVAVHRQPGATVQAGTNMVTAGWQPTVTVATDGWPEGAYLLRLRCADGARYVPMVVRSVDASGRILLVHATSTWAAYNVWGGHSLYQGPGGTADYANRSRVVSFDRPYDGRGAEKFLSFERPVVELAERLQLRVAYTTSAQVHADPALLANASAVVSLGHDEYWTPQMRSNVTAAREAGVNLAFLGANACFRRIRFDGGGSGRGGDQRHVVCYKTDWRSDPMNGVHDALVSNDYREQPAPNPECTLTGTYYEAYPATGAYRVLTPNAWLFAGTGATKGSTYPGLIGPEYDRVNPVVTLPRPMQVLSHSPITCKGTHTYSDSAYYMTKSGAGVFNAGTMNWTRALYPIRGFPRQTTDFVQRVTTNLFHAFQDGPAGNRFPAVDNLDQVKPYVGDPTWNHHNLW